MFLSPESLIALSSISSALSTLSSNNLPEVCNTTLHSNVDWNLFICGAGALFESHFANLASKCKAIMVIRSNSAT